MSRSRWASLWVCLLVLSLQRTSPAQDKPVPDPWRVLADIKARIVASHILSGKNLIAVADETGTIRIIDTRKGKILRTARNPAAAAIRGIRMDAKGRDIVVIAGKPPIITEYSVNSIWDEKQSDRSADLSKIWSGDMETIVWEKSDLSLRIAMPDGHIAFVILAAIDRNTGLGSTAFSIKVSEYRLTCLAYNRASKRFVMGTRTGEIVVGAKKISAEAKTRQFLDSAISMIRSHPKKSQFCAVAGRGVYLAKLPTPSKKTTKKLETDGQGIVDVAFSLTGKYVAVLLSDSSLEIHRTYDGKKLKTIPPKVDLALVDIDFERGDKRILAVTDDSRVFAITIGKL